MQKLIQGIHQFQQDHFRSLHGLFQQLARGQNPETLFITCSDSRIDPCLMTQSRPGDLFILRNAGNIVPPHGAPVNGEAATVEYAVAVLGVKDIIVCGHSQCGAMKALLDPASLRDLPATAAWLRYAEATRRVIAASYGHLSGDDLLTATIEENVLTQLENLRTLPAVAAGIRTGAVHLHGWVYKFETGAVFAYDPQAGQFVTVAEYQAQAAAVARRGAAPAI
jgi:carbonic anhydrase